MAAAFLAWLKGKWLKTQPFRHQVKALTLSALSEYFALLMEQGTGKSWVIVITAAILRRLGMIDAVLIIAPKGVAPGWVRQQFPEHMPGAVPYVAALWRSRSGMSKTRRKALDAVLEEREVLRVVVMNTEAFGATAEALDFAMTFLEATERRVLLVIDESHRIKTPTTSTTKRITKLRALSKFRRILTGTVADKPFDVFAQYNFLDPAILSTDSFTEFKSEYAEMMPDTSGLMRHIAMRIPKKWSGLYIDEITGQPTDKARDADGLPNKKQMVPAYMPQIVATNADGTPRYRNLEKLQKFIAPHSYRVLKVDCLDLPPKLYNRYYTELDAGKQSALYASVRDQHRIEWESGQVSVYSKLVVYLRLQQIICGYIPNEYLEDDDKMQQLFQSWKENPRIVSMLELIEDRPPGEGTIIWCRFREDIRCIAEALQESYGERSVVQFHGGVGERQRIENVERFEGERIIMNRSGKVLRRESVPQKDRPRFMAAQTRAGGIGQTWVAANLSLHYSNSFSLIDRIQAEDRPHRIGQTRTVNYVDVEAEETIDTTIIGALINKKGVADTINGDRTSAWLG